MSELLNKKRLTEKKLVKCCDLTKREVEECELSITTYETVIKSQKIMCLGCNSILSDTRPNYCQYCGRKIKRS